MADAKVVVSTAVAQVSTYHRRRHRLHRRTGHLERREGTSMRRAKSVLGEDVRITFIVEGPTAPSARHLFRSLFYLILLVLKN